MAEQIKFGDRLFLKGEKVLLDNGVSDAIIESRNGTLVIKGNLTVDGTTTTVNTEEITLADAHILLNGDHTGPATEDVGIEVNRGDDANVKFSWDESNDIWTLYDKDLVTTGDISATTISGSLNGNIVSDNSIVIINVTGDGSVDINGGNIDGTVIGATTSAAGTFTTITGDGTAITNVLTNYTTDDLTEGSTNLYYSDEKVDDRIDNFFDASYGLTATYNDSANTYTLDFDPINAGTGVAILDTTDTVQAKFRTVKAGPHLDLSVTLDGDNVVVDTVTQINVLEKHSETGIGTQSIYTLPFSVSQDWHVEVFIDGVYQIPSVAYAITTGTTLTLASPLALNSVMYIIKLAANSVSTSIVDADTLNGQLPSYYLDYNNFSNTPTIPTVPTNVSAFTNDSGYLVSGDLPTNHMVNDADNTTTGSIFVTLDNTQDLGTNTDKWRAIYGHQVEATFADLAERYAADAPYDVGTVLVFGGEAEVTTTTEFNDSRVIGVVSTAPAYLMNADAGNSQTHPAIALKGRVPCKIIGECKKGDLLTTSQLEGHATAVYGQPVTGSVIGKAMEDKTTFEAGMIEIFVSMM